MMKTKEEIDKLIFALSSPWSNNTLQYKESIYALRWVLGNGEGEAYNVYHAKIEEMIGSSPRVMKTEKEINNLIWECCTKMLNLDNNIYMETVFALQWVLGKSSAESNEKVEEMIKRSQPIYPA